MNPETGFSKGTAFVQFDTKEMADGCVNTLQDDKTVRISSLSFKFGKEYVIALYRNKINYPFTL